MICLFVKGKMTISCKLICVFVAISLNFRATPPGRRPAPPLPTTKCTTWQVGLAP